MPGLRIAPAQVSSAEERLPRWLKLQIPEVWVRFLLAIAGLALAFGAAMFSTVSRESGNLVPAFSISVLAINKEKATQHWQWMPAKFSFPPGRPAGRQWLQIPDRRLRRVPKVLAPPVIFQGSAYFPYVPPKAELSAELELRFDRRGRYQQDKLGLATRFPFAFLRKTRRVALAREIVVYPSVEPPDEFFHVLPLITGEFESFTRGRGSDLYRIREYMPEDSARHVDWKATAKSGSLKVREFSREDDRKL